MRHNTDTWLDFSDKSTLFKDAEGTEPVAKDGDSIGFAVNKPFLFDDAEVV